MRKPEPAISRVLSSTTIHLGQPSPTASSNLPGSPLGTGGGPFRPTPLFGLAPGGVYRAANCCQSRGALLPHLFTLTDRGRRYIFCGTFRGLTPPRRYLAPCPKEPGLSSAAETAAIVWPTPALSVADSIRYRWLSVSANVRRARFFFFRSGELQSLQRLLPGCAGLVPVTNHRYRDRTRSRTPLLLPR